MTIQCVTQVDAPIKITVEIMEYLSLQNMLAAALIDANKIQANERTREMSLIITNIEQAELWLGKLKAEKLNKP